MSDILAGAGGDCVAGEALKALALGFKPQKSKDIVSIVGETEAEEDIDEILEAELLDCYDSPAVRQIIRYCPLLLRFWDVYRLKVRS